MTNTKQHQDAFQTPRVVWVCVLVFTMFVLINGLFRGAGAFWDYSDLSDRQDELERTVAQLRAQKNEVSNEILKIKSSPVYASKLLKDRYHQKGENETMILVTDEGLVDLDHMVVKDLSMVTDK